VRPRGWEGMLLQSEVLISRIATVDPRVRLAAKMYELNCSKNGYPASCFNLGRLKRTSTGPSAASNRSRLIGCGGVRCSCWQGRGAERPGGVQALRYAWPCHVGMVQAP
jgi:hypothetical protein